MYEIFKPIWIGVWGIILIIGIIKTINAETTDDLEIASFPILFAIVAFAGIGFADIIRQIL